MDSEIMDFLVNNDLNFTATLDKKLAYRDADFVVIATPTQFSYYIIPLQIKIDALNS
jgi:UDPglucose 6-dehydrogenase